MKQSSVLQMVFLLDIFPCFIALIVLRPPTNPTPSTSPWASPPSSRSSSSRESSSSSSTTSPRSSWTSASIRTTWNKWRSRPMRPRSTLLASWKSVSWGSKIHLSAWKVQIQHFANGSLLYWLYLRSADSENKLSLGNIFSWLFF